MNGIAVRPVSPTIRVGRQMRVEFEKEFSHTPFRLRENQKADHLDRPSSPVRAFEVQPTRR